jgi:hypothetical protein
MPWYTVRKKINGRHYLYLQMTYREAGRVKTKNKYLGPASGGFGHGAPDNVPTVPRSARAQAPSGGLKVDKIVRMKAMPKGFYERKYALERLAQEDAERRAYMRKLPKGSKEREEMKGVGRAIRRIRDLWKG